MYETLVTKEEMLMSEDLGNYFKICPDDRDLNYDKYFNQGLSKTSNHEYNSNNTKLLNVEEMKKMLLDLQEIQEDLKIN